MATNRELTIQVIKMQEKLDRLVFELTTTKAKLIGITELKQQLLRELDKGTDAEQILCIVSEALGTITKHESYPKTVKARLQNRKDSTNQQ